jgi:transcriptional regulator with XRE-family HTH domain
LTQEQLAESVGYSVDFIGLVERGVNAPSVDRLADIATQLKVNVKDLFTEGQPTKKKRRKSR